MFVWLDGVKVAPLGPLRVILRLSPFRTPAKVNQMVIFGSVVAKLVTAWGCAEVQAAVAIFVMTGEPTNVAAPVPPPAPVTAKVSVVRVLVPFQTSRRLQVPAVSGRGSPAFVSHGSKQKEPALGRAA